MTHYESPVKPNSLSWRVINGSCDTDPTKKVFLMGGSLESKRQAVVLRDAFKDLSNKWAKEIEMTFAETKTHFEVAGGNYTFFFVLPALFKAFRKKHPFLRLKLDLLELRDGRDLAKKDADLVLSSRQITDLGEIIDYSFGAKEHGYTVLRKNYSDWNRFAVTDQVCKRYGSKEDVLKHHDFISTVYYVTSDQEERHVPNKVEKTAVARYSVGLYPVGYQMMLNGLGIFCVCKHNARRSGVTVLEEDVYKVQRFLVTKKPGVNQLRSYKKIVDGYLSTAIVSCWNENLQI